MRVHAAVLLLSACSESRPPVAGADAGTEDAGPPFADVTDEMGLDFERATLDDLASLGDVMGGGACLFDLEGDGDLDLLLTDRVRARLYRSEAGRFVDASDEALPGPLVDSMGCAVGDYDADGDPDVYVTSVVDDGLLRNDGGALVDVTAAAGMSAPAFGSSAAWGDVDADGDLDLFVAQFVDVTAEPDLARCAVLPCGVAVQAWPPLRNQLWLQGDGAFREAAAERGLAQAEPSLACALFDLEGDGDLDLYVANDLGSLYPDRLYRNDGTGRFEDAAEELRTDRDVTGHGGDGMGVAIGDPDRDGLWEIAVTNFQYFRVTYFDCGADGTCPDRGFDAGLDATREFLSWGVAFSDFDADGWEDLFVANGHVYPEEVQGLLGRTGPMEMRPQLLWNAGDGTYEEQDWPAGEALEAPMHGRGVAIGDLDGDGDEDVVVAAAMGRPRVLRNERGGRGLRVELRGRADAVGALVIVRTGAGDQRRQRIGGGSYLSAREDALHFGLGGAARADVEVRFASGEVVVEEDVEAGTTLVVEEP